jgi:hypothetical protein
MADITYKEETALGAIERRMSDAVPKTETAYCTYSIPSTADTKVLKGIVSKTDAKVRCNMHCITGIVRLVHYPLSGEQDVQATTGGELLNDWKRYWTGIWPNFSDFVSSILTTLKEWQKVKTERDVASNANDSDMYAMISQQRVEPRKFVWLRFGASISSLSHRATELDKSFVLSHLYKDSENGDATLYWKFKDTMIEISTKVFNGEIIIQNSGNFWLHFFKKNLDDCQRYVDELNRYLTGALNGGIEENVESDDPLPVQFESQARTLCPSCILRGLSVGLTVISCGKAKAKVSPNIKLAFQVGKERFDQFEPVELRRILCRTLLEGIYPEIIPLAKVFSNAPGEGISWLGLLPMPRKFDAPPSLEEVSSIWWKFLHKKFPSEEMGLVRLAYFVTSLFDANNYARQYLYCVGVGLDGKTSMLNALKRMVGKSLSYTIGTKDFLQGNFALSGAINRRLLVTDDASKSELHEMLISERLKGITGAGASGVVYADRKGEEPRAWRVSGAKMVIATNFGTTLEDEATISRMNPLCFLKNYTSETKMDQDAMEDALVADKQPFLQWCFDTVEYYKNVTNVNGEKAKLITGSGVAVLTDEQWGQWKSGSLNVFGKEVGDDSEGKQTRALRREAFQSETTVAERPAPYILIQDTDDDDDEAWDSVARALFVKDDDALTTSVEVREAIIWYSQMPVGTPQRFLISKVGLDKSNSVPALAKSYAYGRFLEAVYRVFGVRMKNVKQGGKQNKALKGLRVLKEGMESTSTAAGAESYTGGSNEFLG